MDYATHQYSQIHTSTVVPYTHGAYHNYSILAVSLLTGNAEKHNGYNIA